MRCAGRLGLWEHNDVNGSRRWRRQIAHNKRVHDVLVGSYDARRSEIYNPTEQKRIAEVLSEAVGLVQTDREEVVALDFGAGTGNLTRRLLNLGMCVHAADVSKRSLAYLEHRYAGTGRLVTVELNGVDLRGFPDASVDMVAAYSVLHHVPDYLKAVEDFARVTRPGGLIYIDHEAAPHYWEEKCPALKSYREELREASPMNTTLARFKRLFLISTWRRLIRQHVYGVGEDGDIHVHKHDHIEWDRINAVLRSDCEILRIEDYLVCREPEAEPRLHSKYRSLCTDMRMAFYRKRPSHGGEGSLKR